MRCKNLDLTTLLVRVRLNRVVYQGIVSTSLAWHFTLVLTMVTLESTFQFKLYETLVWIMNLYFCLRSEKEGPGGRHLHLSGFKPPRPHCQKLIFSVVLFASR